MCSHLIYSILSTLKLNLKEWQNFLPPLTLTTIWKNGILLATLLTKVLHVILPFQAIELDALYMRYVFCCTTCQMFGFSMARHINLLHTDTFIFEGRIELRINESSVEQNTKYCFVFFKMRMPSLNQLIFKHFLYQQLKYNTSFIPSTSILTITCVYCWVTIVTSLLIASEKWKSDRNWDTLIHINIIANTFILFFSCIALYVYIFYYIDNCDTDMYLSIWADWFALSSTVLFSQIDITLGRILTTIAEG